MSEQSPQVPPTDWRPDGPSGPRGSFGRRLVATLVDSVIVGVAYGILLAIVGENAALGLTLIGVIAYYTLLEGGATGQTIGKKLLGIRVVDFNTGGSIGYGRAALRLLGRFVSQIPCYLGYLWMLWDKEKQTWHDKFATSVVVPESYYPVTSA